MTPAHSGGVGSRVRFCCLLPVPSRREYTDRMKDVEVFPCTRFPCRDAMEQPDTGDVDRVQANRVKPELAASKASPSKRVVSTRRDTRLSQKDLPVWEEETYAIVIFVLSEQEKKESTKTE